MEIWSEGFAYNIEFLVELLTFQLPRQISLTRGNACGPRVWTDASFSVNPDGVPICKICAIIKVPHKQPEGIVLQIPPSIISLFQERIQQIHMGELFGPICAVLQWPSLLRNSHPIFYIDNMGVLCNIVNGSSRQLDAGTMTFALHLRLAALNTTCWWEWVESEANCSDGGSRVGLTCPVAKALGIVLTEKQFPELPINFMHLHPNEWYAFWDRHSSP